MKKILLLIAVVVAIGFTAGAQRLTLQEPSEGTSEWEYAANSIARLCPAPLWDGWVFRDAVYDEESNTMCFMIQLKSLKMGNPVLSKDEIMSETEKIIGYFKEGYEDMLKSKSIYIDGDWMLYLAVGNLLEKLVKNNINLQIVLLKPMEYNIVNLNPPMKVTPAELRRILE